MIPDKPCALAKEVPVSGIGSRTTIALETGQLETF
jgi:hypothetical protein